MECRNRLAGNLVGAGKILGYLLGVDSPILGIWIATGLIWFYTIAGGLFSVAYTDVLQAVVGWTGLTVGTYWIMGEPSCLLVFPVFRSIALEFTVSPLLVFPEFGSIALGSWDHEEEVEMVNIKKRTRR